MTTHTHRTYKAAVLQTGAHNTLRSEVVKTLSRFDLIVSEWKILGYIFQNEEVRFVDLASHLRVEPPHITTLIDILQKKKLVQRKDDPTDRRAKRIVLTKKAQDLVPEVEIELSSRMNLLLEGITPGEMATYFKVLEAIVNNGVKLTENESITTSPSLESSKPLNLKS